MQIEVNTRTVDIPVAWQQDKLLHVLREELGLVGAKFGCGVGACGACTVLINGEPQRSCVIPISAVLGPVTTVEGLAGHAGLADGQALHPLQQAWLDEQVAQCGYCQSGQILAAAALLRRLPDASPEQIDAAMSGQLCRCGTQHRIRLAVQRAQRVLAMKARFSPPRVPPGQAAAARPISSVGGPAQAVCSQSGRRAQAE